MLILRTCSASLRSRSKFPWPKSGRVKCPDWKPTKKCGNGLHGLAWGVGDGVLLNWSNKAKWLVVDVPDEVVIDLEGKVKFPFGNVVHCGSRKSATDYLLANGAFGKPVVGASVIVGDRESAVVGYRGKAIAGEYGTAIAGYYGTAIAGEYGTATAGECGIINIAHADYYSGRYRQLVGYIGENGLLPNVKYSVKCGKFVRVAND